MQRALKKKAVAGRGGFTLTELLAVLAIVAVLAALLFPAVGGALEQSRRAQGLSNLQQIATAYATYTLGGSGGGRRTLTASNAHDWALTLAREQGLNQAALFALSDDPAVQATGRVVPVTVGTPSATPGGAWTLNADFAALPLSYTFVSGLPAGYDSSTTPVAWTRGLNSSGTWNGADEATRPGVYGSEGGHIAYLDRHVVFYRTVAADGGKLLDALARTPTSDIRQALPPGAQALDSAGVAATRPSAP